MPRSDSPPLTEQERKKLLDLWKTYEENETSEEYCLEKANQAPTSSSDAVNPEALALVEEQMLNLSEEEKDQDLGNTDNLREKQLIENASLANYAMQVYRASVFFVWHIAKTSGRGPERVPTISEEERFKKQFYCLYRLVIMSDQRFAEVVPTLAMADLVRLGNLHMWLSSMCSSNQRRLAQIFHTARADMVRDKLRAARDAKARKIGLPRADLHTEKGYAYGGIWSVFDEIQGQIEYNFPEDLHKKPPRPEIVY